MPRTNGHTNQKEHSSSGVPSTLFAILFSVTLYTALLVFAYAGTIANMVHIWLSSPTYQHGFLIIPISLTLGWLLRSRLGQIELGPWLFGLFLVTASGIGWYLSALTQFNLGMHFFLVALFIVGIITLIGPSFGRAFLFPLLFLFSMVPFGAELTPLLQDITAGAIVFIARLFDIAVLRDGMMLRTPSGLYEVAEACAGLRFLVANVVIGVLFSWLSFASWKMRAGFVLLAFLIPVLANCIRASATVIIATYTNNKIAAGVDHIIYGWGFFGLVMMITLGIGVLFSDRSIDEIKSEPFTLYPPHPWTNRLVLGCFLLMALPALLIELH